MLKLHNCSIRDVSLCFKGRKIIFFGCGSWLQTVCGTPLMELKSNFAYVIDNNPTHYVMIDDLRLSVFYPSRINDEKDCIIVLSSPVYMYEMYLQLQEMDLEGRVDCYALPFMVLDAPTEIDNSLLQQIYKQEQRIPKIIHSFWFSEDEKAEAYQRCVDTWKEVLPDYEIIEWNQKNYDCSKNPFLKRAIELGAWAFASDYARLDVLNEHGGIYLDMDVEMIKSFNDVLGNSAILSFSNSVMIDLAVIGSEKGNPLVLRMLQLYEDLAIPDERNGFTAFFQPVFIRKELIRSGIRLDGTLQKTEDATVFPSVFFMPQEHVLFRTFTMTEYAHCVHHDNFGWSFGKDNKKEKKIRDNNKLWKMIG